MKPGSAVYDLSNRATLELPVQGERLLSLPPGADKEGAMKEAAILLGSLKGHFWDTSGETEKLSCWSRFDGETLDMGGITLRVTGGVPRALDFSAVKPEERRDYLADAIKAAEERSHRRLAPHLLPQNEPLPNEVELVTLPGDTVFLRAAIRRSLVARGFLVEERKGGFGDTETAQWFISKGDLPSVTFVEISESTFILIRHSTRSDIPDSQITPEGYSALEFERCFAEARRA